MALQFEIIERHLRGLINDRTHREAKTVLVSDSTKSTHHYSLKTKAPRLLEAYRGYEVECRALSLEDAVEFLGSSLFRVGNGMRR